MGSEACIFRKTPMFRQSEILTWDEEPVPVSAELIVRTPGQDLAPTGNLYRRHPDPSRLTLVGDGIQKGYQLGPGWDCLLDAELSDGLRWWTRQRAVGESALQTWTTIVDPDGDTRLSYSGHYALGPRCISGVTTHGALLRITRRTRGLTISLDHSELAVHREWRIDEPSQRRVLVFDDGRTHSSGPVIIVSSESPDSLRKTTRWLILELTGLVVAEQFLRRESAYCIKSTLPETLPESDGLAI